jgi:hypothetical protein
LAISTAGGNFSETFSSAFSLDHPFGGSISIIGDNASNITLSFTGASTNGFTIDTNHSLAAISNVSLAATSSMAYGLYATTGATIGMISSINFTGFYSYVYADFGANLTFASDLEWSGFSQSACSAFHNALVNFVGGPTLSGSVAGRFPGEHTVAFYGLDAEYGGEIIAPSSMISDCERAVYAHEFGSVVVDHGTLAGVGYGVYADAGSHVSMEHGSATGSTYGVYCASSSMVDAVNAIIDSHDVGTQSFIYTGNLF